MCIGMYVLVHACSRMYVLVYVCVCVYVHSTNSLFQALYMYVFVCLFANTQLKCNREYNFKGTPLRYIHIFANTCIYINILYPYNHIRTYTYIYVHLYLDVFRTFRHQYVLIHTYTYVYIHIHDTHTCIYWQILPDTFTYKYTRTHTRVYVYTRQRTTGSRGSARHCQWVLGRAAHWQAASGSVAGLGTQKFKFNVGVCAESDPEGRQVTLPVKSAGYCCRDRPAASGGTCRRPRRPGPGSDVATCNRRWATAVEMLGDSWWSLTTCSISNRLLYSNE